MPKPNPDEVVDAAILERAAQCDYEAWCIIQARVHRRVAAVLKYRDPDGIDDATQDALLNISTALAQESGLPRSKGEGAGAWVTTIATHKAIDYYRASGRRAAISMAVPKSDVSEAEEASDYEMTPRTSDRKLDLNAALSALSDDHLQVVLLLHRDKLTYREAAEELGVPVNTVKSRAKRALAKMGEYLGEDVQARIERSGL